jgi:hypothetical protein
VLQPPTPTEKSFCFFFQKEALASLTLPYQ